jgi:hypothetical protein
MFRSSQAPEEPGTMIVTMLGRSGSGKSTFIAGMYAQLVQGFRGCYLHTPDHDAGVEMVWQLNRLRAGDLPEPNSTKAIPHDYVLRSDEGTFPLDLTDYRGGAPFDLTRGDGDSDTALLRRRLAESHSIFVALDSSHFMEPVTRGRLHDVREETGTDLFSDLISKTVYERQQRGQMPPSVAVLLTKADQIDGRQGSVARDWDEVRAEIREVLGGAFQPGVDSRIIPVSVFGTPALNGQPQMLTLELYALADPVIFAAATFLRVRQAAVDQQYQVAMKTAEAAQRALRELTAAGPIIQWFRRKKIIAAQAEVSRTSAWVNQLGDRWRELGKKADVMLTRLESGAGGE